MRSLQARACKGTFFCGTKTSRVIEKTVHDLQVFLQVTPRSLTTTTRKVNHAAEWIKITRNSSELLWRRALGRARGPDLHATLGQF